MRQTGLDVKAKLLQSSTESGQEVRGTPDYPRMFPCEDPSMQNIQIPKTASCRRFRCRPDTIVEDIGRLA